jgi:hypothetical protein
MIAALNFGRLKQEGTLAVISDPTFQTRSPGPDIHILAQFVSVTTSHQRVNPRSKSVQQAAEFFHITVTPVLC